ncbi:MAG: hypothetical protein QOH63_559 [Acidobacteriota bacterium]|jgi:hypothetical protein|nr:hypothetical protein [Acidobacteriota bacterium]
MQRLTIISVLIFLLAPPYNGQSAKIKPNNDNDAMEKSLLIYDLQSLEAKSIKLDEPIARALAMAEIADAAWSLDKIWAKKLLKDAYELTFPAEEERTKLRDGQVGDAPTVPTDIERARSAIRNRVLSVSSRDKAFANELAQLGAQQLGRQEEYSRYSNLAARSLAAGDKDAASQYLLQSIKADPTQIAAGFNIINLAAQDRKAADKLIVQYIDRLRAIPLSTANGSALRTYFSLRNIIFTNESFDPKYQQIPPAGPVAIKAYVNYVLESMSGLEQREPGSAQSLRGFLISTWLPLNQYAPELVGPFLALEKLSRRPGGDSSLPQVSNKEAGRDRYEERVRKVLDSGKADDLTINFSISRGDYKVTRKLIDLLPDGEPKRQFTETVNTQEAISLAAQGDILGAERLAQQLDKASSILQAYPVIINKCIANKDSACATSLTYQALKQLKRAEDESTIPLSLSKLAKLIAPVNDSLALEVLDEVVLAANRSSVDTKQGNTGLDVSAFKQLAPKNEARVRQAATSLTDSLRQIISLAAIYQWKAEELSKRAESVRSR